MSYITIEDIRAPQNRSGFRNVGLNGDGSEPKPYQAFDGREAPDCDTRKHRWKGPRRATAEEAAQDYCNYINGGTFPLNPILKSADHPAPPKSDVSEKEKRLRRQLRKMESERNKDRKGYVYLVAETIDDEVLDYAVKIGHSYDPPSRPNGLQTGNPRKLKVLGYFEGTLDDERALHVKYIEDNILQEWFKPSPELIAEFVGSRR